MQATDGAPAGLVGTPPSGPRRVRPRRGFLSPPTTTAPPGDRGVRVLDQEVLHRPDLVGRLRRLVADPGEWEICGYLSDRDVGALARVLGLGEGAVSGFDAASSYCASAVTGKVHRVRPPADRLRLII
ncbi:hypothetical protein [Streptomyces cyaneofuscatus]|uniref:preATP grasp domain-containing protein n=1 Tax=Streptomyces cyaneofuscatus TaxID=66883 RepID=UPI0037A69395